MVYEKADSVRSVHVNAPAWLHKYIIGRNGEEIRRITQNFPKVYVEYIDKDERIKIEGQPEEVDEAQKSLEAKVQDLVSRLVLDEITVDPKFYKHIIGKSGANVNRLKEEAGVMINIGGKNSKNVIRIEGDRAGVAKAKKELEDMVHKLEDEKEKNLIIDHYFHKSIIGAKGKKIREIGEKYNQVRITFPNLGDKRDVVTIRGPKKHVDKCSQHLLKLVKELSENSYSLEVPIYKQFHKFIIGKRGGKIQKIRDETQTKIVLPVKEVENDVITITGKKDNVEEARKRILNIQNQLENIATEEMSIPPLLYHSLIGPRGKVINSIMEDCGGVNIKFPSADSNSDIVVIRGPKEDVEKAKQLLNEMINERQRSDHYAEVRAKAKHHRYLIGRNGAKIRKLRESTGARIMFPNDKDDDKEVITILGTKEAVDKAKAELEAAIADMDNIVEAEMKVDPKHHQHFVARRGEVLSQISEQFGDFHISFPRSGNITDRVTLKGSKDCIEDAKARIQEIVNDLDSMVTIECVIPQKHHRSMIGAKGKNVQSITSEFEVQIKFPDRDTQDQWQTPIPTTAWESNNPMNGEGVLPAVEGADEAKTQDGSQLPEPHAEVDVYQQMAKEVPAVKQCDIIRITGKKENCEAAKVALLALEPVTIEVSVPFDYHRLIIGQKGRAVGEMRRRYDVNIVLSPAEKKLDIIKISGSPAAVEKAKEAIEEKCRQLDEEKKEKALQSFEIKIEVDPDYHPKIIGKKGIVINKIRYQNNVKIIIPKKGDLKKHIITITGYEEAAKAACDDIMKIVNALKQMVKEEVNIDPRVHSRLIGVKGRNIDNITTQYGVDIKFPCPKASPAVAGIVTITGPEEAVLDAKDHLLNLEVEYNELVKEEVIIHPRVYSKLIGARDQNIHKIMKQYGVDIKFPSPKASPSGAGILTISGPKEAVLDAMNHLFNLEEKYNEIIKEEVNIDPIVHSKLIGVRGQNIHKIMKQYGVDIKFPHPTASPSDAGIVTIIGPEEAVLDAKDHLLDLEVEYNELVKEEFIIHPTVHSKLIGARGRNIHKIMEQYGVDIKFPSPKTSPSGAEILTISGPKEAVLDAKDHLLDLEVEYKQMVKKEVNIDPTVHSKLIGAQGRNIHKIMKQYGVDIKFPHPTASPSDAGIVTINGPEDAVLDAKDHLLDLEVEYNELVKEEVIIHPRVYSKLIGARDQNIHKIMKQYGVDIKFPSPKASPSGAGILTISGPKEAVLDAMDHLFNLEEKYLLDVGESLRSEQTPIWSFQEASSRGTGGGVETRGSVSSGRSDHSRGSGGGFVVKGGPWEQHRSASNQDVGSQNAMEAPDTASTEEFLSFGGSFSPVVTSSPWGPRLVSSPSSYGPLSHPHYHFSIQSTSLPSDPNCAPLVCSP